MDILCKFISNIVHIILNGLGIHNLLINNKIILSNGHILLIANECTGYRSMISLLIVSLVLCFIDKIKFINSILLLLSSIIIAFIGNIVRVTSVAILSNWYPEISLGIYHEYSGYIIFIINLLILFRLCNYLKSK